VAVMAVAIGETRAPTGVLRDVPSATSCDVLAGLRRELDRLVGLDPSVWCDGATLVGLLGEVSRVEALVCRQAAAFGGSDEWSCVGARTVPAWLAVESRCDPREARARVRRGRALGRMDIVSAAFLAGRIRIEHVDRLARACTRRTLSVFVRDEAILVEWASSMEYPVFVNALKEWLYRADPDGSEKLTERQHRRRQVHLSQSFEDTWHLNGVLDSISVQIVHDVLARIERELFEADWTDATQRLGRDPHLDELARTTPQRRADALVDMATRAATAPTDGQRPAPLLTLLVGVDAFTNLCQLAAGTNVTPGEAARWLDASFIERIVFDGPDRVLSVGRQRTFTGALRRAIRARDRTCAHPYCDTPAEQCEIDHIVPWAVGGQTSQANGRCACRFHNRHREPDLIRRRRRQRRARTEDGDGPGDG
jgi:hypothetical protein